MPARVHLVSIHPEVDENNQLTLKMVVGGDSRERAIDLARRMEESRRFTQTYIETEHSQTTAATGDAVQFDIAGVYVPDLTPPAATKTTTPKTESSDASKSTKNSKGSKDAKGSKNSKSSTRSKP